MRQKKISDYFDEAVAKMKDLNTYKPEYDESILVYATLLHQHDIQFKKYAKSKYADEIKFINGNGIESSKPNPLIKILESLRKDIKLYADALCLTPKANNTMADTQKGKLNKMSRAPTIPFRSAK